MKNFIFNFLIFLYVSQLIFADDNPKDGLFFGIEADVGEIAMTYRKDSFSFNEFISKSFLELGLRLGDQLYYKDNFGARMVLYGGIGNEVHFNLENEEVVQYFLPLSMGVDFDFLYDFLQKGTFVMGINFGVGYRFRYYYNRRNKGHNFIGSHYKIHQFYPQLGIHFYFGRHQVVFNYKFGGILYQKTKTMQIGMQNNINFYSRSGITDYLGLEYLYRF